MIMFLATSMATIILPSSYSISLLLETLPLEGHFSFKELTHAAKDFGNRFQHHPLAVLHPNSVSDIANTVKYVWEMGLNSGLTVAARGCGHSLHGQAQAHEGIVINMGSLRASPMKVVQSGGSVKQAYVDVYGGELWINILHECLKYGLTPKSWTDYLHLSVGGTLSNAGVSGQAFLHGPQISNVLQLEVVTGMFMSLNPSQLNNIIIYFFVINTKKLSAQ